MKTPKGRKTIRELVEAYFKAHPNEDLEHGPVVDWVTEQWRRQGTSKPPRDPWRVIRRLHQEGWLIKVRNGVYRYDPATAGKIALEDFTPEQKQAILERDGYRCVICGRGRADGVELHVDHIKPRHLGGRSEIENGQTLCARCNIRKKIYKQTETGKRMFIRLLELANKEGDTAMEQFCREVLEVYEKHGVNDHIRWER
ncbi:MAG: HNH endonuclease [Fimbriimonadales bacterium]|nr:HNH endonuclease [Fimbriimonadales bacterium]